MPYFEEIKEAYESVRDGETSQESIQKALQYENWRHLPGEITKKVVHHRDYSLIVAYREQPIPTHSRLPLDCQMPRHSKRIGLAYSLYRSRGSYWQRNMIEVDDLPQLWEMFERGRIQNKRAWITTNHLALRSKHDLNELASRLGLYHWLRIRLYAVFCLEWRNIECVKPNALDAGLAFYFHQTSEQTPGSTRNLRTGEMDMEEWLCLKADSDSIKCVGGCSAREEVELNMSDYYKNNAQRIRGSKTVWKNSK